MPELESAVLIDGRRHVYPVEGDFFVGSAGLLYDEASSTTRNVDWQDAGYCVTDLLSPQEFEALSSSIEDRVRKTFQDLGVDVGPDFRLVEYHEHAAGQETHLAFIDRSRMYTNDDFQFDLEIVTRRLSDLVDFPLSSYNPELERKHVQLRISRPGSLDVNPPHRDGYLDFYAKVLNVWIPIVGCNEKSSLPVVPGSHLIREEDLLRTASRGASISGNTYNVPCISRIKGEIPRMMRPNPQPGQALVFSPFLIHGAAFNTNADTTRMALELRLYPA